MNDFYKAAPDGLIGNEDCGQMSAWYVLSWMGFYPVCPGKADFDGGKMTGSVVTIHPEKGSEINIHSKYEQGYKPVFFQDVAELPKRELFPLIPVPVIAAASRVFDDSMKVEITGGKEIWYAVEDADSKKEPGFKKYSGPFTISSSKKVLAYSGVKPVASTTVSGTFYKRPNHWKITINSKYNPQYTAGGDEGLIDGLRGETNWRKGEWQGYQYQDFEAVIDLGEKKNLSTFSAGFLQDSRSWILMPSKVEFYASGDNKEYVLIGAETHKIDPKDDKTQVKEFTLSDEKVKARYIKVKAYNFGKLPEWHQGYGDSAFIFIDEISVK
jgi:hypothetical protein